tara:strand:- start:277 stop:672 length:396 start_codon:yes stop_codon:yes gene_type:complete
MKTIKHVIAGGLIVLLTSCGSTAKFPTSTTIPAAEIVAKSKTDKNNNTVIEVTAKNLASADRLDPPKESYVVWITTEDNGTKNIGLLNSKNGSKAVLKTSTPFKVREIYITAENQGNISYPAGIEISRTSF